MTVLRSLLNEVRADPGFVASLARKPPHPTPPQIASESYSANQIAKYVFTQPGSVTEVVRNHYNVRLGLDCVAKVVLHPRSKILKAAGAASV
jgi:hypothetical protein